MPYSPLLIAVALAAVISAYYIRKHRQVSWINTGTALLLAGAAWSTTYALELSSTRLEAKILLNKLQYLSIALVPAVWLAYVLRYTGHGGRTLRWSRIALGTACGVAILLALIGDLYGVMWSEMMIRSRSYLGDTYPDLVKTAAPGYWYFVAYFWGSVLISVYLLIRISRRSRPFYRGQVFLPLGGIALIAVVGVPEMVGDSYPESLALSFTASCLAIAWSLSYLRRGDLVAVSRRMILENIPDPVMVLDASSSVVSLNPACERLIDGDVSEIIWQPVHQAWPAWSAEIGTLDQEVEIRKEMILVVDGEQRTFDTRISPLRDWRDRLVSRIAVMRDITEHKQAEEDKEALQAQLVQARKMEAVGTLAAGIAHDFNNLLTAIQGNTTLAKSVTDPQSPCYEDLQEIELACMRATRLTRQLLLFSRKQAIRPISLYPNATVIELIEMLERLIGEDIAITTELAPDVWMVRADKGGLEQVVINLVINARDAMPYGGDIVVQTENVVLDKFYCQEMPEARPGRFVCLTVNDTGEGMSPEVIAHLFEPFYSTKDAGQGTGLGLAVVHGIVQQHEGWIEVYSEVGQGTTFQVYLPATSEEVKEDTSDNESPLHELQGQGECILLVEDDKSVREFAARVLAQNGYSVLCAGNTQEAMHILEEEGWRFDLVFSDVVLPDRSGLDLADDVIAHGTPVRILLSSGYTGKRSRWETIRQRGISFLQKPYTLAQLLTAIREATAPQNQTEDLAE
jgi:PAS domain S-box-containing protein